jgi:hypothetical protein
MQERNAQQDCRAVTSGRLAKKATDRIVERRAHAREADWISAAPGAIDRAAAICCCASAHRSAMCGDANGGDTRTRNKPDAGSHDAICRIVNVLAVDDSVRGVCYRRRDPER